MFGAIVHSHVYACCVQMCNATVKDYDPVIKHHEVP